MQDFLDTLSSSLALEIQAEKPEAVLTERDLELWLARHIAHLLEHKTEFLFNIFYCMDVDEDEMRRTLDPLAGDFADLGLARLLIARHKQRLATKRHYTQPEIPNDDIADWQKTW